MLALHADGNFSFLLCCSLQPEQKSKSLLSMSTFGLKSFDYRGIQRYLHGTRGYTCQTQVLCTSALFNPLLKKLCSWRVTEHYNVGEVSIEIIKTIKPLTSSSSVLYSCFRHSSLEIVQRDQ